MFGKEGSAIILDKFEAEALKLPPHGYTWEYWR
jgi:hypothetical protein